MAVSIRVSRVGKIRKKPFPIETEILKTLRDEAEASKKDFERTARTWRNQPTFSIKVRGKQSFEVITTNAIYGYLDEGTPAHPIAARNAKTLRFNTVGFKAKSRPNSLSSLKGSAAKPPAAFPKVVQHPGFPARNYAKLIKVKSQTRLTRSMDKLFQRLARA